MTFKRHDSDKEPKLNIDTADKLLNNIFTNCELEPHPTPLSELELNVRRHRRYFILQKVILGVMLLLLIAAPLYYIGTLYFSDDTAAVNVAGITQSQEEAGNTNDHQSPVVESHYREGDAICLVLSDDEDGIDYEGITAKDAAGASVAPLSYDADRRTVVFAFPEESLNVFIPDNAGNTLQVILTVK